ncbi:MAG: metal ABC transporter substrate-binding protein [Actinomycetota bacterium]
MRRLALLTVCLLAASCGGNQAATGSRKISVVASLYPLAFLAEEVGGRFVQVRNLTPHGAEPHDLELKPAQVALLGEAGLVLYLGGGFQPSVRDALTGGSGNAVDLLAGQKELSTGSASGKLDPHVWLAPARAAEMARVVRQRLEAVDRRHGAIYRANAASLTQRLEALDAEFSQGLKQCARRAIVTSHEAFGYLAEAYRLEQIGVSGLDPEAEPTPGRLKQAVDFIRRTGATTVYFESLVSPAVARTLAREAGVATAELDPIEGKPAGGDYFSEMRRNLAQLRKGLECI